MVAAAPIAIFLLAFFFPIFPNNPCSALVSCPYGKVVGYESTVTKLTNSERHCLLGRKSAGCRLLPYRSGGIRHPLVESVGCHRPALRQALSDNLRTGQLNLTNRKVLGQNIVAS